MSIVLTRVDDRLIHGQIVVAWGQALSPDRYVVADDDIAEEEPEHDIYRAGVPAGLTVEFLTIEETGRRAPELEQSHLRTIVLLSDVTSAVRLCEGTSDIRSLNLGGVHEAGGRVRHLPYLCLSGKELDSLRALAERGVDITVQDVPASAPLSLGNLS